MYNFIPLILGGIIAILGLFMVISPKSATKKELQNDATAVSKTKKNGIIIIACGAILLIFGIMRLI